MHFHIITLFPESFTSYLQESIIGRALAEKKIQVHFYDPRKYAPKELKKKWPDGNVTVYADGRPFGGGPGMVLRAEPYIGALEKVMHVLEQKKNRAFKKISLLSKKQHYSPRQQKTLEKKATPKSHIIFFSPGGKKFTTSYAKDVCDQYTDIIFVCGRYEGIDARIKQIFNMEDVSIGDYVLTGGELPAMVCIDCIARQVPGVLGNFDSREEERVASHDVYTRPEVLLYKNSKGKIKKYAVPPVLLSGNPKLIDAWKKEVNP